MNDTNNKEYNPNEDPNWVEYWRAFQAGELEALMGQYVAYNNGKLVGNHKEKDKLVEMVKDFDKEIFLHQVGSEPRVIKFRRPKKVILE